MECPARSVVVIGALLAREAPATVGHALADYRKATMCTLVTALVSA